LKSQICDLYTIENTPQSGKRKAQAFAKAKASPTPTVNLKIHSNY
jgi:hypothetical protein